MKTFRQCDGKVGKPRRRCLGSGGYRVLKKGTREVLPGFFCRSCCGQFKGHQAVAIEDIKHRHPELV